MKKGEAIRDKYQEYVRTSENGPITIEGRAWDVRLDKEAVQMDTSHAKPMGQNLRTASIETGSLETPFREPSSATHDL